MTKTLLLIYQHKMLLPDFEGKKTPLPRDIKISISNRRRIRVTYVRISRRNISGDNLMGW